MVAMHHKQQEHTSPPAWPRAASADARAGGTKPVREQSEDVERAAALVQSLQDGLAAVQAESKEWEAAQGQAAAEWQRHCLWLRDQVRS